MDDQRRLGFDGSAVVRDVGLIVERHLSGPCPQCPPDPAGCEVLVWARLTLAVAAVPTEPKC